MMMKLNNHQIQELIGYNKNMFYDFKNHLLYDVVKNMKEGVLIQLLSLLYIQYKNHLFNIDITTVSFKKTDNKVFYFKEGNKYNLEILLKNLPPQELENIVQQYLKQKQLNLI